MGAPDQADESHATMVTVGARKGLEVALEVLRSAPPGTSPRALAREIGALRLRAMGRDPQSTFYRSTITMIATLLECGDDSPSGG